ncbi:cell cycle checkpoint protein RAD17 [Polypterus senegalus]
MSKVSRSRKVASSKLTNWVQPSFDLFTCGSLPSVKSNKRTNSGDPKYLDCSSKFFESKKRVGKRSSSREHHFSSTKEYFDCHEDEPWVEKYKPKTQAELAVHKKKIEEVESWLKVHTEQKQIKKGGPVLMMTGPSGCGKTATIYVLSQELGIEIQEWSNPLSSEFKKDNLNSNFDCESISGGFSSESQTHMFQEFLLRANRYNKLQLTGETNDKTKKVILVEDIPNQFYRQPAYLHDILRKFSRTGRCPLIFIISDSLSGNSMQRLLFPSEIQEELKMSSISFNPVAPTSMLKVLSRIAVQEATWNGEKTNGPDKDSLHVLCNGCSGDIRSAINSLQFSSLKDYTLKSGLQNRKKGKFKAISHKATLEVSSKLNASHLEKLEELPAIGGKDVSLFLFRALGKILHFKREPRADSDLPQLPNHLSEHERCRLLLDPEMILDKTCLSGELFSLYLHQNYLDFYSEIDDVVRATEYLSDADFFTAEWSCRSTLAEYSAAVSTRGIIHSNKARCSSGIHVGMGFKPFHKPQWLIINKKYRENCLAAKSLFVNFCLSPTCLQTQLLPYLALLTNPMRNQAQISFIQDIGILPLKKYLVRPKLETLTDKDTGHEHLDSDEDSAAFSNEKWDKTTSKEITELQSGENAAIDLPDSQPQPTMMQAELDEEEFIIEDYDSD